MKDIINEILSTEKRVEEIVQKAREQAQEIKQKADVGASQKVEKARKTASQIISTAIEEARNTAQRLRDEKLKKAEEEGKVILSRNQEKIDKLIQDIVQLIIHTEYSVKGS